MKSKVILSAVVAASIALSGSVFAAPGSGEPTNAAKVALYNNFCGGNDHSALRKFIIQQIRSSADLSNADKVKLVKIYQKRNSGVDICDALKKRAVAQHVDGPRD